MKVHVRVETDNGQILEFTDADTVDCEISTPYDKVDVTPPGATATAWKLTTPRFKLDASFPEGAPPRWSEPTS